MKRLGIQITASLVVVRTWLSGTISETPTKPWSPGTSPKQTRILLPTLRSATLYSTFLKFNEFAWPFVLTAGISTHQDKPSDQEALGLYQIGFGPYLGRFFGG
jgi:hypothetical protein